MLWGQVDHQWGNQLENKKAILMAQLFEKYFYESINIGLQ